MPASCKALLIISAVFLSACTAPQLERTQTSKPCYKTAVFEVSVPKDWDLVSAQGPDLPVHATLLRRDHAATVTVRVQKDQRTLAQLCARSAAGYKAAHAYLIRTPQIEHNTCKIEAVLENGKPAGLSLRMNEREHIMYAMHYEGSPALVQEALTKIDGDPQLMPWRDSGTELN